MSFEGEHASHKIFCGLLLSTYQTQGIEIQRLTKKGLYVVARILFLPLLNCSAWPCLGPVKQDLHTFLCPSVDDYDDKNSFIYHRFVLPLIAGCATVGCAEVATTSACAT